MHRVSSSANEFPVLGLAWPAGRIGGGRDSRRRWRRAWICGNFGRRRLRQSYAHIHLQMFLRTARAKALASVFVAEAGQFVAAVDTVAISCDGGSFNGHQSHCVCPFWQDSTSASRFSQELAAEFHGRGVSLDGFQLGQAVRPADVFPQFLSEHRSKHAKHGPSPLPRQKAADCGAGRACTR